MSTLDAAQRINDLRRKVLEGHELSREEVAEAISLLRQSRAQSLEETKKRTEPIDLDALFATEPKKEAP